MEPAEVFYEDSNSLPYIISPAFLVSFVVTLLCPLVLSPLLWPRITLKYHTIDGQKSYLNTLLSSTIHAVVVSGLTVYILSFGVMGQTRAFSKSPLGFATMQISLGYFLADFFVCLMDPLLRKDRGSMFHHIAGITGISLGLFYQGKFMFFIVYRLISELSTPFVNMRWTLHAFGKKTSKWYLCASLGMMATFFFCRIVVIPWHWYELGTTIVDPASHIVPFHLRLWSVLNFGAFDVLNAYWFSKMIKGAVKLYQSSGKDIS